MEIPNLAELLILGLATWRTASLLADEEGPFDVLEKLRHWLGVRYDEHSERYGRGKFAERLMCVWCDASWAGVAWAVFWLMAPKVALVVALPFALAAIAQIVHQRGVRHRKREWS